MIKKTKIFHKASKYYSFIFSNQLVLVNEMSEEK